MKTAIILFFAILSEVIAPTALKLSDGFTKIIPSVIVVIGYGASFYSSSPRGSSEKRKASGNFHSLFCL